MEKSLQKINIKYESINLKWEVAKTFRICTTDSNHSFSIFPNKFNQNSAIGKLGKTYVSDITYIEIVGGFSYLTTAQELFFGIIIKESIYRLPK